MPIDLSKLNPRGKLKHLVAKDMFKEGAKQVFDAHTGKYLGMVDDGKGTLFYEQETAPEETPAPIEIINPNQTTLF